MEPEIIWEICCNECNETIGWTSSTEPLPWIVCDECKEDHEYKGE